MIGTRDEVDSIWLYITSPNLLEDPRVRPPNRPRMHLIGDLSGLLLIRVRPVTGIEKGHKEGATMLSDTNPDIE